MIPMRRIAMKAPLAGVAVLSNALVTCQAAARSGSGHSSESRPRWQPGVGLLKTENAVSDKEGRLILREFETSLMSDTKWRKLFIALDDANLKVYQCIIKLVDEERPRIVITPDKSTIQSSSVFYMIEWGGYTNFRAIEWLEFPKVAVYSRGTKGTPAAKVPQDLDGAQRVLDTLGRYPVERHENGLRIVGHRRRSGN
jgi:hypothetical protein